MSSKRKSKVYFIKRAWHSLFNGLFIAKLRRHILNVGFVRRALVKRVLRQPIAKEYGGV